MELCLLLVDKKIARVKRVSNIEGRDWAKILSFQIAVFLAKLVDDHPMYLHAFLFDQNLFADIRVLLINEIIWKRFQIKLSSIDEINQFFCHVEVSISVDTLELQFNHHHLSSPRWC